MPQEIHIDHQSYHVHTHIVLVLLGRGVLQRIIPHDAGLKYLYHWVFYDFGLATRPFVFLRPDFQIYYLGTGDLRISRRLSGKILECL